MLNAKYNHSLFSSFRVETLGERERHATFDTCIQYIFEKNFIPSFLNMPQMCYLRLMYFPMESSTSQLRTWKKCLMPLSPVDARDSKCTKLFLFTPIAKIGSLFFFISSAAGVPSVTLTPSVIITANVINLHYHISKSLHSHYIPFHLCLLCVS